ncbi:hypothetical protein CEXT_658581 [Caerostris extrusa]|uniref:Uncharacterized protein n=1 Tax=Caerostris extrusa TaxID=172846 RepID=A0AAV4RIU8_CAEEX|nr:hypothetical protein CEXT_658581 [Caerostris extrusa]
MLFWWLMVNQYLVFENSNSLALRCVKMWCLQQNVCRRCGVCSKSVQITVYKKVYELANMHTKEHVFALERIIAVFNLFSSTLQDMRITLTKKWTS